MTAPHSWATRSRSGIAWVAPDAIVEGVQRREFRPEHHATVLNDPAWPQQRRAHRPTSGSATRGISSSQPGCKASASLLSKSRKSPVAAAAPRLTIREKLSAGTGSTRSASRGDLQKAASSPAQLNSLSSTSDSWQARWTVLASELVTGPQKIGAVARGNEDRNPAARSRARNDRRRENLAASRADPACIPRAAR